MRLLDILPDYVLERNISPGAAYQLGRSLTLFGTERTEQDLQPRIVSDWLQALEKTYSRRTVAGHRGNLLTLWRWAARRGLATMPTGVRRCPRPRPRPVAWTADEFRRLLAACDKMPSPEWWRLVLEAAYSTGLRRSDLWRIGRDDVRGECVWLTIHKTGVAHACRISHATAEGLLRSEDEHPLRPRDTRAFYAEFSLLCRLADVRHGCLQMIRRTGATQVEIARPGCAQRYLGHLTPGMAAAYVDRSQIDGEPISPPEV